MFIDISRNNGEPYLRLANSNRVENSKGFKIPKKEVVLCIGFLEKFDDGKPDYIERLRKSFKPGNPLIESLKPYCSNNTSLEEYHFRYKEGDPAFLALCI
jgi:hypothetical protein